MEAVLKKLGNPGKFHCILGPLLAWTWWTVTFGNISHPYYVYTPDYRCKVPDYYNFSHGSYNDNFTFASTSSSMPAAAVDSPTNGSNEKHYVTQIDKCSYQVTDGNKSWTEKCDSWIYGGDKDHNNRPINTAATEWNLVCDMKKWVALSSTIYMLGVFVGALVYGFLADKFGRKRVLAVALFSQMPISLALALNPSFVGYLILRFSHGIWLQGISSVAFIYCIEFFRTEHRALVMVMFGFSWATGQLLMAFMAYISDDWRDIQLACTFFCLIAAPYYWWLPESPRWLIVKNRIDEIIDTFIKKAVVVNGLEKSSTVEFAEQQLDVLREERAVIVIPDQQRQSTFWDMVKERKLLIRLLVMCYIWGASSMTYYMILININSLAGNRYLNFAIGGLLEIVQNVMMIYFLVRHGRKHPLLLLFSALVVFCVLAGTLPTVAANGDDISWVKTAVMLLGKFAIAAVMCYVFVYAAEIFPTFARGGCMALCGCSMRLGGVVAPMCLELSDLTSFPPAPYIFIAATTGLCALLVFFFLPETFGTTMPNTIADAMRLGMSQEDINSGAINDKDEKLLPSESSSSERDTVSSLDQESNQLTQSEESCQ